MHHSRAVRDELSVPTQKFWKWWRSSLGPRIHHGMSVITGNYCICDYKIARLCYVWLCMYVCIYIYNYSYIYIHSIFIVYILKWTLELLLVTTNPILWHLGCLSKIPPCPAQVKFIRFPDNILDRLDLKGPWDPGTLGGAWGTSWLRCAGHTGGSSGKAGMIETSGDPAGCKGYSLSHSML